MTLRYPAQHPVSRPPPSFILATAGHVDHGKSALVKALTGTDPDRLPEEKERGITIDLGFAHLELIAPVGNPQGAERYSCGIVDVPGHEDFVRNMVAGVGSIDLALLVVAADDGWMPQTEEHLQILLHLGVERAVVALAKSDLVPDPEAVATNVRLRLAGTALAEAPIVPTSVVTGGGLDDLRSSLASVLAASPLPADIGCPRLWVDRAFALHGIGTVVTGTLTGGWFKRGDPVLAQPGARPSRVRSCQSHGREKDLVGPGMRVALNLPDLAPFESDPVSGLRRGAMITTAAAGPETSTLDVVVERSPRPLHTSLRTMRPLKDGAIVLLHLGSGHVPARLRLLDLPELTAGSAALAQLRLERPGFAFAGDRFILRDPAQQVTLAGGRVLDPDARRAGSRNPDRLRALAACMAQPEEAAPFILLALQRPKIAPTSELLRRSRFDPKTIATAIDSLVADGEVVRVGGLIAISSVWCGIRAAAIAAIEESHRRQPGLPGLALTELRAILARIHGLDVGFDELVSSLARSGFLEEGKTIRHAGHQPTSSPTSTAAEIRILQRLGIRPLDPPIRRELATDAPAQQALRRLVQARALVELGPDIVVAAEVYDRAREVIRVFLAEHGTATAGELREALATTRRVIIPLLERCDREGLTRRDGNSRSLRKPA